MEFYKIFVTRFPSVIKVLAKAQSPQRDFLCTSDFSWGCLCEKKSTSKKKEML
jgi:hypothetical protein